MAKAEWGTKRTCPKCSARFYDLGNDDPIVCIECGEEWKHEPILKSRPSAAVKPTKEVKKSDSDDDDEDDLVGDDALIEIDDDSDDDDDDVVLADVDDDDDDVSAVIDTKVAKEDD